MSEALYRAVKSGRVRLQDLNEDGKQALRDYMSTKTQVTNYDSSEAEMSRLQTATPVKEVLGNPPKSQDYVEGEELATGNSKAVDKAIQAGVITPEFAQEHPTASKLFGGINTVFNNPFSSRVAQAANETRFMYDEPNKSDIGKLNTPADILGGVLGFLTGGELSAGNKAFELGSRAVKEIPNLMPSAGRIAERIPAGITPYLGAAAEQAGGGLSYELANSLANGRDISLGNAGLAAGENAIAGALLHGAGRGLARLGNTETPRIDTLDIAKPVQGPISSTPTITESRPVPKQLKLPDRLQQATDELQAGIETAQNYVKHNDILAAYPAGTSVEAALADVKVNTGIDLPQLIASVEKAQAIPGLKQQALQMGESSGLRRAAGLAPESIGRTGQPARVISGPKVQPSEVPQRQSPVVPEIEPVMSGKVEMPEAPAVQVPEIDQATSPVTEVKPPVPAIQLPPVKTEIPPAAQGGVTPPVTEPTSLSRPEVIPDEINSIRAAYDEVSRKYTEKTGAEPGQALLAKEIADEWGRQQGLKPLPARREFKKLASKLMESGSTGDIEFGNVRDTKNSLGRIKVGDGDFQLGTVAVKRSQLIPQQAATAPPEQPPKVNVPAEGEVKPQEAAGGVEPTVTSAKGRVDDIQAMPAGGLAPVSPASGQPVLNTVRRREIVKFLDEKLNVPIRVGRFNIRSTLGIFKVKPEVIRSRIANDLPTISHEVGHKLDKQLNLANPMFDTELMALGRVTSAKNYTSDQVRKEGVAEFMRLYLTNAQAAQKMVPKYYAAFEQKMLSEPDIYDTLLRARQDIYTWYNQPAKARVLGVLSTSQKSQRKMTLDRLYSLTIDEIDPIRKFVEDVGVKGLPIEKDPYKLAWLARGWTGKAETFIRRGILDANGKKIGSSLNEILKPIENELDDFRGYAMSKHSLEVTAQGKNTGILDVDAKEVIKNSPAKYQQVLDNLVKYQDVILNQLVDAGVMDAAAVQKMRKMYPNYIPFQRVFNDDPKVVTEWLSRGGFANLNNPVKKMKGSDREIIDPLESIIKNTYTFINIAEKNKVGRAIAELANAKEGLGRLVEKVDGSQSARENILKVYRDGKPEYYQLQPDLYRATLALDSESANVLVKLLQYPAGWLRAGATLSPDFMIRNPIRDMFSAFINSKYGFIPAVDTMRGLFHAVKKDDLYWQWMNSGGAHSMMVSIDRDYLQKSLKDMLKKSTKDKVVTVVNPKTYLDMLRALSEMGEQATRLGEFGKGIRSGASPLEAALASRDVTLDFSRVGSKTKSFNRVVAFLNAQVQGMDKTVRQAKSNPLGFTAKVATSITLPSVLLYFNNRNDPRYQELPRWEKDLYWIIPTENHLFRIPKPFELGILFGSVPERILEYIDSKDKKSFDELGKTIWSAGMPNIIPTALLPAIEAYANYSFFTDRAIVNQREQKLEAKAQYGPQTTEIAKTVGNITNISPKKIEHVFRGYTGGLGMYAVKGGEALADVTGIIDRTPRPSLRVEDVPGIKAVMSKPYESTQSVKEFYDELSELESQYQTAKQNKAKLPEGFSRGRLARLRGIDQKLQDLRKRERQVESSKTMTPEFKRKELERLNMLMLNAVRGVQGKSKLAQ